MRQFYKIVNKGGTTELIRPLSKDKSVLFEFKGGGNMPKNYTMKILIDGLFYANIYINKIRNKYNLKSKGEIK